MKTHLFSVDFAVLYGIESAVFISNFDFWIAKNKANNKHFYNNKYWTYNSARAFMQLFPYFSEHQIRRILKKMMDTNIIEKGNFNKFSYDQTLWYTFTDSFLEKHKSSLQNCEIHLAKSLNGTNENERPIPDIKTNNKTKEIGSTPSPEIEKISPQKFYQTELLKAKEQTNKPLADKYQTYVDFMFGKNDLGEPLKNILKLPKQISFQQFDKLLWRAGEVAKQLEKPVKILDIIYKIENTPKYYKNRKSLYLIVLNWLDLTYKY